MKSLNHEAGEAIDSARDIVAEQVVAAQFRRQPQLEQRYGAPGRAKCLQDARYHLSYLSQAVAADEPALFADYLRWSRSVLASRGIPADDLAAHVETMDGVLRRHMSPACYEIVRDITGQGRAALAGGAEEPASFLRAGAPLADLAGDYLQHLLDGDRHHAARLVLEAAASGSAVADIYLHVFQPVQRELGRLWQTNRIGVAEEHYCSAATQLVMSQLYPRLFAGLRAATPAGRLVAAAVSGELHEIGVRMVADLFETDGWRTCYLGANTPASGVVQALIARQADVLCISATMTFNIPAAASLIAAVRSSPQCAGVKILVGGYPFMLSPGLAQKLGADGTAGDAAAAVDLARSLLAPCPERCQ